MTDTEELGKVYREIDEIIPQLKIIRSILWLKDHKPDVLVTHAYGDMGLENALDFCIKKLYKAQENRLPF